MRRSALNYGIFAVGLRLNADGTYSEKCGSSSVRFFDQRWGLARMADEAREWAKREQHDAYQLQKAYDGFRTARPVGEIRKVQSA